ncbi:hypothetical protein [Spongiactinospora sp. TRM90649]|uniref:hypothetical protein n=1 Tax=Spongiactinospora sp. TRM90649 TaxID=3031114 RepID=UPI0023F6CB31|nr:hypothetical protein [Spongiactinospora sp. TRM90649]MDF5751355.1 hypothetical protein [Spongiactinospora sp. TRM90649]
MYDAFPDASLAPVDEHDIAAVVAAALLEHDHVGHTYELSGLWPVVARDRHPRRDLEWPAPAEGTRAPVLVLRHPRARPCPATRRDRTRRPRRQRLAERALHGCLIDPAQLARIADPGLCHGWAGLLHTSRRIAATAASPAPAGLMDELAARMLSLIVPEPGFLNGMAGVALALAGLADGVEPVTAWDACLLLTPYDKR